LEKETVLGRRSAGTDTNDNAENRLILHSTGAIRLVRQACPRRSRRSTSTRPTDGSFMWTIRNRSWWVNTSSRLALVRTGSTESWKKSFSSHPTTSFALNELSGNPWDGSR